MAITDGTDARRGPYVGDDATTVFAGPPAIEAGDITVYFQDDDTGELTLAVLATDYTLTGYGEVGAEDLRSDTEITLTDPLASGTNLIIDRVVELVQPATFPEDGALPSAMIRNQLDRMVMAMQQMQLQIDRCVRLPDGETADDIDLPAARATKVLGFDTDGAIEMQDNGTSQWLFGAGAPSDGTGSNGDYYLNSSTGGVYSKAGGTWSLVGTFQGAQGVAGSVDWTQAADAILFAADADTGVVRIGANSVGFRAGGSTVLTATASGTTVPGDVWAQTNLLGGGLFLGTGAPAQITANQNNYALPSAVAVVTFDLNAAREITGFVAPTSARHITIWNRSAYNLTLKHESASSTAANRFFFAGADFIVPPNQPVSLFYDTYSSRWRMVANYHAATAAEIWAGSARKIITPEAWTAAHAFVDLGTITTALDINGANGFRFVAAVGASNFTLNAPQNLIPGRDYMVRFTQANPVRTITFDAAWLFPNTTHPVLSTTASRVDELWFRAITSTTASASLVKHVG